MTVTSELRDDGIRVNAAEVRARVIGEGASFRHLQRLLAAEAVVLEVAATGAHNPIAAM